jgi:hypothetical protein
MAGAADIPAFRSMRTLRALRPLRAVSRWEGMRVSKAPEQKQKRDVVFVVQYKEKFNSSSIDVLLYLLIFLPYFSKKI